MPKKKYDKARFVLGVDLDGVCADFIGGLRPIAAEWLGAPVLKLPERVRYGFPEWKLKRAGNYDDLHRFAVTQRNLFRILRPIEGSAATLRRLSARNVRIRIITNRLYIKYFHQDAVKQTVEWLDEHGIPYWDLCLVRDKVAVGANLYIEDSPDNIEKLLADKHKTIIFTNSTNTHLKGLRADSWAEVERLVLKELAIWRTRAANKKKRLSGQ